MSFAVLATGVALLGGLGAVTRFLTDGLIQGRQLGEFPLGTFVVNLSGTFLLGLLAGLDVVGEGLLLAGTATLGSYTTFSTWFFETHRLAQDGEWRVALANLALSLGAGLAAAELGLWIGGLQ